ncbi:hypothetical protein BDP27DRAFT_1372013 [Rhodocollybia butyracea]|uniref:Uncharacterized protein n=1 Tax=Rhodocollybia butyracea TaxID=206335 RepID=A0A9P5P9B4_9AGAR|nr:hypothetical protein BDP27DRAFT_1372013 [Rhodocollybia butyracea]
MKDYIANLIRRGEGKRQEANGIKEEKERKWKTAQENEMNELLMSREIYRQFKETDGCGRIVSNTSCPFSDRDGGCDKLEFQCESYVAGSVDQGVYSADATWEFKELGGDLSTFQAASFQSALSIPQGFTNVRFRQGLTSITSFDHARFLRTSRWQW